jgi:hypothetical protein
MAQIGSLPASASAVFNLDFLPEYLLIGETSDANQVASNLSVVTSGVQLFSITNEKRITALAKFDSGIIGNFADLAVSARAASYLRLATGRINKATTITATNSTATITPVYAASTNMNNVARRAVEQSINPSANATFDNFEALIFDPANVLRAQITFANGYSDEYTPAEINAYYAKYHATDKGGKLSSDGLSCIDSDSGGGLISQVVLYAGSGAAVVVLKTDYVQL